MNKNYLLAIFGMVFLALAMAPMVSAGIWNNFESNPNANTLTVNQGDAVNFVLTATSHGAPVSNEKIEAIQGSNVFPLKQWNEPGSKSGNTYIFAKAPYTLDTNVLGAGTFTIRFSAQTTAGLESADLTLVVNAIDTGAPTVTINNPVNGNTYTAAPSLDYTAVDPEGNLQDCRYSLDGGTTWSGWVACSASFGVQTPLTAGLNTWTVEARDFAGNVGSASVTFTYNPADVNAPTITVSVPTNGGAYNALPTIDYTPVDTEGNLNTCWYVLNGATSLAVPCTDSTLNSFTAPYITALVEGTNTLEVFADDLAANVGSSGVITFTIDTIAPVITPVAPLGGDELDDTNVKFQVSLSEAATVEYSLDGGVTKVTMNLVGSYYEATDVLADDTTHTVTYYATDAAGNAATPVAVTFSIDEVLNSNDDDDPSVQDPFFHTKFLDQFGPVSPSIDLTDDDANNGLNWWQRFVNWLCRLFGLKEIY